MIGRTLEIKAYFKHRNIRSIMRFYSYSICILFTCYLILKHWGFPFSTYLKNIAEDLHRFVSSAVPFVLTWYTQSSWGARRLPESLNESVHEYFQDRANNWVTPPQLVCCAGLGVLCWLGCVELAVPGVLCSWALTLCVEQPFLLLTLPSDSRGFTLCVWAHP